jgi:hypothetical protein
MKIIFHNYEEHDSVMLNACVAKINRFYDSHAGDLIHVDVEVFISARDKDGILQYPLVLPYPDGGQITVVALQRAPGEQVEFHS